MRRVRERSAQQKPRPSNQTRAAMNKRKGGGFFAFLRLSDFGLRCFESLPASFGHLDFWKGVLVVGLQQIFCKDFYALDLDMGRAAA